MYSSTTRNPYQTATTGSLERCSQFVSAIPFWEALNRVPWNGYKSVAGQTQHLMQSSDIWYCLRRDAFQAAEAKTRIEIVNPNREMKKRVESQNTTYKWRELTWRRWESGEGREGRRSGGMKRGRPFRVERRRAGVSIGFGQLPSWSTPARALPLLQAFTANFMAPSVSMLFAREEKKIVSLRQKESERTREKDQWHTHRRGF